MAYTNVAVLGAGGNLGKHFMNSLLASTQPKFSITVLARPSSSYTPPTEDVKVVKHELTDHAGMVEALRGVDAVIMMQGVDKDFIPTTKAVIEAAIAAGVKMVMPSDYGSKDTPIFTKAVALKPPIRAFVEEKAKEGKISYTFIKNGAFFSMPLKAAYGIDCEAKTVTFFGDGTQKFHTTTLSSIGQAIVGVLRSPAQFSNKTLYIHDFYTTQREILSIVEAETSPDGTKFETTRLDMEEMGEKCLQALNRGEYNHQNIMGVIRYSVWGKDGAADWDEKDDSEAVGLERKDLKAEIKKKMLAGM